MLYLILVAKEEIHINFLCFVSYLLYLHIFQLEIKVKMYYVDSIPDVLVKYSVLHCWILFGLKRKSKNWNGVISQSAFGLNDIRKATQNTLEINSLNFNHFHTILLPSEVKRKEKLTGQNLTRNWTHSFLNMAMLHWVGFLNSWTSPDMMGYLQGVEMELMMWVNSRNGQRSWRLCDNCRNECHHWYMNCLNWL